MKKMFLTFWAGDGGDTESNSVYYSKLVYADDKEEAITKHIENSGWSTKDREYYGAIEMTGDKVINKNAVMAKLEDAADL